MYGTAMNDIHPVLTRRERLQNLADENAKLREDIKDLEGYNQKLRDMLWQVTKLKVKADFENAKLREELADAPKCETCEAMLDCDECLRADGSHKERRRISSENAKLRELLQMALTSHDKMCTNRGTCLGCLLFNAKPFVPMCPIVSVTRDARELGVEVDG